MEAGSVVGTALDVVVAGSVVGEALVDGGAVLIAIVVSVPTSQVNVVESSLLTVEPKSACKPSLQEQC